MERHGYCVWIRRCICKKKKKVSLPRIYIYPCSLVSSLHTAPWNDVGIALGSVRVSVKTEVCLSCIPLLFGFSTSHRPVERRGYCVWICTRVCKKKKKNSASHIHPSLRFFHFILPRGVTLGWTYAGTGGDNRGCRERRRAWGERSCWANAQVGRSWVGKPRRCRGKERGLEPSDEESAGPTCWRLPFLPLTAASTCFDGSGTRS